MIKELNIKVTRDGVCVVATGGQGDIKDAIVKSVKGANVTLLANEIGALVINALEGWEQFVDQMTDEQYTELLNSPLSKSVIDRIEHIDGLGG